MTISRVVSVAIACLFLYSGSFKVHDSHSLASTLRRVGVPSGLSGSLARALTWSLLVLAVAILLAPAVGVPLLFLAATLIAAVGLRAMALPEPIPCSCFSSFSGGTLGWRQLAVGLAVAAGGARLVAVPAGMGGRTALAWLTTAMLATTALHVITGAKVIATSVSYRRAVQGVYPA